MGSFSFEKIIKIHNFGIFDLKIMLDIKKICCVKLYLFDSLFFLSYVYNVWFFTFNPNIKN